MSNQAKRNILKALVTKANANELSLPSFASEEDARQAYEAGRIKKGDVIYVNGVRGKI